VFVTKLITSGRKGIFSLRLLFEEKGYTAIQLQCNRLVGLSKFCNDHRCNQPETRKTNKAYLHFHNNSTITARVSLLSAALMADFTWIRAVVLNLSTHSYPLSFHKILSYPLSEGK